MNDSLQEIYVPGKDRKLDKFSSPESFELSGA